jgi:arabinogalactan endo-1,4-beta-galactosidase
MHRLLLAALFIWTAHLVAQHPFYYGSDLSYVNEMEDCGAVFSENGQPKDVYQIFKNHKTNLARFRLWHTPSFYDTLNTGKRYSDFTDVRKSIGRAKAAGMHVLLDFHLSDFWADPNRQWVPNAWLPVVNNLPALQDSMYQHIYQTLMQLHAENLLPELVQVGNETNKGILQTEAQNMTWWLDWPRNGALFKRGIQAVRDVEAATGKPIRVALHVADPADAGWLMQGFWSNGVQDFDIIGLSYYWAWHKPVTIAQTGAIITQLRNQYPGKSVMIFETGYIWTNASNDQAPNIISEVHPNYSPASPANQKKWLTDLTQEVISRGGEGVMYWEPAWVSTSCKTPWGQGSHQEHATFFDFNENMLPQGGMLWPEFPFITNLDPVSENQGTVHIVQTDHSRELWVNVSKFDGTDSLIVHVFDAQGRLVLQDRVIITHGEGHERIMVDELPLGPYFVQLTHRNRDVFAQRILLK